MTVQSHSNATFRFRLFIAGGTPNSVQAQGNLTALCRARIPNRYEIEVVDVFLHPERAMSEQIFMTPMLIVLDPSPQLRIAGTLGNSRVLEDALGLSKDNG